MRGLPLAVVIVCVLASSPPARAEIHAATMPDHVLQTINKHGAAIRRCYDRGLRQSTSLGGKLVVRFRVGTSGQARPVTIVTGKSTLRHSAVERCIKRVFRAMRFRRAPRPTWYSSPIIFGAG